MALSPQQIAGQTSVLCRFVKPDYDSAISNLNISAEGNSFGEKASSLFKSLGNMSNFAGLLGPVSKSYKIEPISSSPIDIKQDFMWTSSKSDSARLEMPYVFLREKIVDRSSRLQNAIYSTVSLVQSPLGNAAGAVGGAALGSLAAKRLGVGGIAATGLTLAGGVAGEQSVDYLGNLADKLGGEQYQNNLKAYSGLYSTTPTGFVYKLPFVKTTGNISKSISQSWERGGTLGEGFDEMSEAFKDISGSAGAGFEGLFNAASGGAETVSLLGQALDQANRITSSLTGSIFEGAYTESAKTFSYGTKLPGFEISFYLFNNLSWAETVKNWYAVFCLQYQNLPNRLNRLIVTPSVIYEAMVPGYFYSMYTAISNIDVSFLGSNLLINMPVIENDNTNSSERQASTNRAPQTTSYVNVIVPEVYKVSITFESLVPETQNLMLESMFQTRANGTVNTANITQTSAASQSNNLTLPVGVGSGATQGRNIITPVGI